jgi:hypothetical protein
MRIRWSTTRLISRCSLLSKPLNMVEPPDSTMFCSKEKGGWEGPCLRQGLFLTFYLI